MHSGKLERGLVGLHLRELGDAAARWQAKGPCGLAKEGLGVGGVLGQGCLDELLCCVVVEVVEWIRGPPCQVEGVGKGIRQVFVQQGDQVGVVELAAHPVPLDPAGLGEARGAQVAFPLDADDGAQRPEEGVIGAHGCLRLGWLASSTLACGESEP
jgi:hypothetical protein